LEVIRAYKPTGNYIYDKQFLDEFYETHFGICDHLNSPNELDAVAFHPGEDFRTGFLYENYLRTFMYKGIGQKFNITFDQYLDRPRADIEMMNKIAEEMDAKKAKISGDAEAALTAANLTAKQENRQH